MISLVPSLTLPLQVAEINSAAVDIVREVAEPCGALIAGSLSQTPTYLTTKDKARVMAEAKKQCTVFKQKKVDFMLCEVCKLFQFGRHCT